MDPELRKLLKETGAGPASEPKPGTAVPPSGAKTPRSHRAGSKSKMPDTPLGKGSSSNPLKKAYFFFEDRYYAVLDQINKVVPIYKLVDPIDKAVPSFPLLIGIIAAVIVFFMMFSFAEPPMFATLHIVDNKDDSLDGVTIELSFDNQKKELLTDNWGEVLLEIPESEVNAKVALSKEGFEPLEREIELIADETTSITMQPEQGGHLEPDEAEKTVKIIDDSTNSLLTNEVTLTFQCRPQGSSPPSQTGRTGEFQVTHPRNCTTLSATAESDGYLNGSKTLGSTTNYINLTPNVVETTGDISVMVKDSDRNPEANVVVRAVDEVTTLEAENGLTTGSGNARLEDLKPGSYTISVISADGRAGQETGVSVTAGETTNVSITLPTAAEAVSKKIYLKLVERGTQGLIADVQAFIYDGNVLIDSTQSNSQGLVEKILADPKPSYLLVFTHPEFVTVVEPSISPKERSETEPITVLMARATTEEPNPTSGKIIATVVDEASELVEDALVSVYSILYPGVPLKAPPGKTLQDGTYTFSNLAPGDYLLKAKDEQGKAEGQSEEFRIEAGATTEVQVTLVLGAGTVEVKVFDQESASQDPVPNAEVKFIDRADRTTVLASCTTSVEGKCESEPIPADRFVYVSASADEYLLKYAASTVDIVNRNKAKVEIGLVRESSLPLTAGKIDTQFRYFCDDMACEDPANRIQSDPAGTKTYYALFEILISEDGFYPNLIQHIRIGPDSEIDLPLPNDYKAKIKGVSGPLLSHAILSTCWNNDPVDPFTDLGACATNSDAKQANVYYPDLQGKQIIPVVVKFMVEPGLPDGTRLEFHFRAESVSVDEEITMPNEKVKYFLVNEALCDQQDFAWSFILEDSQGQLTFLGTDSEQPNVVTLNQDYTLTYMVYNCSGRAYSNASISAENKPVALEVISFTQSEPFDFAYSQESFSFLANVEISHSLPIFVASEAVLSELEFRLDAGLNPTIESIPFSVSSDRLLKLEPPLTRLYPYGTPDIRAKVSDNTSGSPLENVLVNLKISDGVTRTAVTGPDGMFSILHIEGLEGLESVTLTLRKAGYKSLEMQIEIGTSVSLPDPSLDCITVERTGQETTDIYFDFDISSESPPSDSFSITNGCLQDVKVSLESELKLSPSKSDIPAGETKRVVVNAKTSDNSNYPIAIGEYGIGVKAMYASDDLLAGYRGPIHVVRVYVTDPDSCFKLLDPDDPTKTKTAFDLKTGLADGLIKNTCFVFFEDLRLPTVEKVANLSAVEGAFSLVFNPPTKPAEAKVKSKVFTPGDSLNFTRGSLTFNPADSGGYVFVNWVDFFMTDKKHNSGDGHVVLAQTNRAAWQNITLQLPYTAPTPQGRICGTGCSQTSSGECKISCRAPGVISGPVIDNDGWVDTETYYPSGAIFSETVTKRPIWQGQHNVCNANIGGFNDEFVPCSVDNYFRGVSLTSYNVGMIANKIELQVIPSTITQNASTLISGLRWEYISTDKSHEGLIDFKIRNHSVMGEIYALIEVEDTTGRDYLPVSGDNVGVDFTFSKRGVRLKSNSLVPLNSQLTLEDGDFLGVSVDEAGDTKYYVGNSLAQLSANLSKPAVPKEISRITFTPNESTSAFSFDDGKTVSTYLYYGGAWSGDTDLFDFDPEDEGVDPEEGGVSPHIYSFEVPTPTELIAYENNSGGPIIIDKIELIYVTTETTQKVLESGRITINAGAGEDQAEAYADPDLDRALPLGDAAYEAIDYIVESSASNALVFFSTGERAVPDPYNGIAIIAKISSVEEGATTQTEKFHVRLIGEPLSQCLGYNGLTGSTGPGSSPRVLFDWDWGAIDMDSCSSDNLSFIYCDPTQFTISLIQRLEKIRLLAEEYYSGTSSESNPLVQASELQTFTVYLVEDAYVQDFRNDFVSSFSGEFLTYDPTNQYYPWGRYLQDSDKLVFDTSMARFSHDTQASPDDKLVAAGLHEVYIDLNFSMDQFDFFYTQGTGEDAVVDLRANITLYITKLADPIIKSPFYYLPFNGDIGLENGIFQRDGYGLVFDNTADPIAIVSEGVGEGHYTTDSPQDSDGNPSIGRKSVITDRESGFGSANFENRGRIMNVAQDQSQIDFLPSIATPVLLEMIPQGNTVQAYYSLTGPNGVISPPASFMNLWTGSGSSMKTESEVCTDFYGSKLEYRRPDRDAESGSCVVGKPYSFGFNYDPALDGEKLYFETVFYTPAGQAMPVITLKKSCNNASNFYAPGPGGITQKTTNSDYPVSLSIQESKAKIATMQDVVDLVGEGYVCISSDAQNFSFWWNPQKVLSELDSIKNGINDEWESGMKCEVAAVQQ